MSTTLVLKVDLNCCKCYKKIRKILCKFHYEIKGKIFDEKNNTVTIHGPFDPIKFSKKLKCKAGDVIKSIEIKEPKKPPAPTPEPKPKAPEPAPKETEPKPKVPELATKVSEPVPKIVEPVPATGYPVPFGFCCRPCYEGYHGWGPWYHPGYGRPPPCYDAHGRSQCYCGCGGNKGNVSGCDVFFIEESPTTCIIM